MTPTLQLNTPTTVSIPGVGKVVATISQPLARGNCYNKSYQTSSRIGLPCLRIDWSTLCLRIGNTCSF